MSDVLVTGVDLALIPRRCRDLARGAGVEFVVDTVLRRVVEIGIVTTSRPITVTLTRQDGSEASRTQQPNLTRRYDVSVDLIVVRDEEILKGDGTPKIVVAWPFTVQF